MAGPAVWRREVLNAVFYILRSGCPWRQLPADLPPWNSVYRWFAHWRDICLFERINHALVAMDRDRIGREASPSAAIIDSQSVKTTESGGPRGGACPRASRRLDPRDAGKKIKGRMRHALTGTDGRALLIEPHPANIQDRDGGAALLQMARSIFPFIERVFADGGYAGNRVANATAIIVEIVRKHQDQTGCLFPGSNAKLEAGGFLHAVCAAAAFSASAQAAPARSFPRACRFRAARCR